MIEAVIERCAGIDVGKKFLVVCVMTGPLEAEPKTEIRKFGTIVAELELLRDWLIRQGTAMLSWRALVRTGNRSLTFWRTALKSCWPMHMMSKTGVVTRLIPMTAVGLRTCFATA